MNIDIHSHFIPENFIQMVRKGDPSLQVKIEKHVSGSEFMHHDQGYVYPLLQGFFDPEHRIKDMDKARIDMAVLSSAPPLFYYWVNSEIALKVATLINNSIKEVVDTYPDRFIGMATIPMQDTDLAVNELKRCVNDLGFRSVQIGSNIEGKQLDDPQFLPFFKACNDLGVLVTLHPYYVGAKGALEKYYLTNLIGNPLDSVVAATSLVFGGVLEKCPNLKVCIVHGGGYFPYQFGRLEHGYKVRNEPKINGAKTPGSYLKQLYFDSILFNPDALEYLVKFAGIDHVVMGTDYPFDMGETGPVDLIESIGGSLEKQKPILGENAAKLLGI
jgi:aminocarboxymuconate-semialdehyde decarboxylase